MILGHNIDPWKEVMWETEYDTQEASSFVRIEEEVSKTKLVLKQSWSEPIFNYFVIGEEEQPWVSNKVITTTTAKMSVQFLSQLLFKPFSYLTVVPTQQQQQQRKQQQQQQQQTDVQSSDIGDRDDRSRQQLFETLYNVDMTSGEGMCLSELYLCDPKNNKQ